MKTKILIGIGLVLIGAVIVHKKEIAEVVENTRDNFNDWGWFGCNTYFGSCGYGSFNQPMGYSSLNDND